LTDASNPRVLWVDAPEYYGGSRLEHAQRTLTAHNRRLTLLRSSVLFSALAAEAYANEFLAAVLTGSDIASADRLATPDKLLLGPRLAGAEPPLARGEEPFQTITRLFRVRNALVHPRPDGVSAYVEDLDERDKAQIGPRASGDYLLAVAQAIVLLNPLRRRPGVIGGATYLARHPDVVAEHLGLLGDEIASVPKEDDPIPVGLIEQARRRAMVRGRAAGNP
jgi:hypothetical protein